MNYYGKIVSEIIPAKDIYQFLQEALKRVTKDKPFRGPPIITEKMILNILIKPKEMSKNLRVKKPSFIKISSYIN
jgi:hypothetical protein